MGFRSICRITLILIATTVLLAALALTVVAGVLPAWHVVDVDYPSHRYHQFGLWMHCTRPYDDGLNDEAAKRFRDDPCNVNKPADDTTQGLQTQVKMHGWKLASLILLGAAFVIGILTLLISFCGFCMKWFTIGWALTSLASGVLMIICLVIYAVNAHDLQTYRLYRTGGAAGGTVMQFGFSFWCGVAAAILYMFNFILVIFVVCLSFGNKPRSHDTARVTYTKPPPNAQYAGQQNIGMNHWSQGY